MFHLRISGKKKKFEKKSVKKQKTKTKHKNCIFLLEVYPIIMYNFPKFANLFKEHSFHLLPTGMMTGNFC